MNRKKIIVTGANGSIGKEIVRQLIEKDCDIIMACRNIDKAINVKNEIINIQKCQTDRIEIVKFDASSFDSIKQFADEIKNKKIKVDGLINNAGGTNRNFSVNDRNIETTIMTNYISAFALSKLIAPLMNENSNIVNVISLVSKLRCLKKDIFNRSQKKYSQLGAYADSKVALTVFTSSLSELLEDKIRVNAADPGIVDSGIIRLNRWFDPLADKIFRPLIKTPKKGAVPIVNAVLSGKTEYAFRGKKCKPMKKKFKQHKLKSRLWDETESIVNKNLN